MSIWNYIGISIGLIFLAIFIYHYIANENVKEEIFNLINNEK